MAEPQSTVNALVGTTATKLTRPAGATRLVMVSDTGAFRLRIGDFVSSGMPTTIDPAASVTNGTAGIKLATGVMWDIMAPANVTVKGYNATDVLTYWYY